MAKEYREKNKKRIKIRAHKDYLKNKEKYIQRTQKSYQKRIKKYHISEIENIWENVKASKFVSKKRKKDKEWARKINLQVATQTKENQAETIEGAIMKGKAWTRGEIEYLRENRGIKTYKEMALELERTYCSILPALQRYKIPRVNRILVDKFDKIYDARQRPKVLI